MSPSFRSAFPVSATSSSVDVSNEDDAVPFEGHTRAVYSVAYSPNGKQIATGAQNGLIIIWDSKTGTMIKQLQVSGSADHALCIWDTTTGASVGEKWNAHSDRVWTVRYSPDDETIASGGRDSLVRIWDAQRKMKVVEITEHPDWVNCVTFSPDGTCLATACDDSNIRIFDVRTGDLVLGPLLGHTDSVRVVTYSPDGMQLASGSEDRTIRTWDAQTGALLLGPVEGHTDIVLHIEYSPDGKTLLSSSFNGTIRIWDSVMGELVASPLRRHYGPVIARYSPDGAHFVSAGVYGSIRLWDATTRDVILPLIQMTELDKLDYEITGPFRGHTNFITDVAYFPDGMRVASASHDKSIRIWNVQTGAQLKKLEHPNPVHSLSISPDGKRLVGGGFRFIRMWDCTTWQVALHVPEGHSKSVNCVTFSPDGSFIATAGAGGELFIWNSQAGQRIKMMSGHDPATTFWTVAFSPDGRRIASDPGDSTIHVWNVHNGETIAGPFKSHSGRITSVAFSPDGKTIASGSTKGVLRVWDLELGKVALRPIQRDSYIHAVAYSPDGKTICTASEDDTISLWHATTGALIFGPLRGHRKNVSSLAFSPDGTRILTGSYDQSLKLWDSATGEVVKFSDSLRTVENHNALLDLPAVPVPRTTPQAGLPNGITDPLDFLATSRPPPAEQSNPLSRLAGLWTSLRTPRARHPDGHHPRVDPPQDGDAAIGLRASTRWPKVTLVAHGQLRSLYAIAQDAPHRQNMPIELSDDEASVTGSGQPHTREPGDDSGAASGQGTNVSTVHSQPHTSATPLATQSRIETSPRGAATSPAHESPSFSALAQSRIAIDDQCPPSFQSASPVSTTSPSMDVSDEDDAVPFEGHTWSINSVAYSLDGEQIATGATDGLIIIWDSKTGHMVQQPEGHTESVRAISFSRNGSRLASGSNDRTLCIWDTTTGEPVGEKWEAHSDDVLTVDYSPDDEMIASGGKDRLVRIWDAQGKMKVVEITEHPDEVNCVTFSPDGTCLATACDDSNIRIFNVRTGDLVLGPLAGHTDWVRVVTYSPDGMQLASGSDDRTIRTWDTQTGALLLGPVEGHTDTVLHVEYSPNGKTLLSSSFDGTIRIWDSVMGQLVADQLRRHYGRVIARYSPDGARFISAAGDGSIRLWDATIREVILPLMTEVDKLDYEITGPFRGHTSFIRDVAYFPDGMRVASASDDNAVRIWVVQTGAQVKVLEHSGQVYSLSISSDGQRLASGGYRSVMVWDCTTWQVVLHVPKGHSAVVNCVTFSPDGSFIATAGDRGELFIWNSQTGRHITTMTGHDPAKAVWTVAFSPDGQRIASGSGDTTIRVWDAYNAQIIAGPLEGHSGGVTSVAFSPDGKTIASVSADATLRVWDLEIGSVALGPIQHNSRIHAVSYAPDGKTICTASKDGTIFLKDVSSLAFSPDGKRVITGSYDQTLKLWDSATGEVVKFSDSTRMEDRDALLDAIPGAVPQAGLAEGITDLLDFLGTSRPPSAEQSNLLRRLAGLWSSLRTPQPPRPGRAAQSHLKDIGIGSPVDFSRITRPATEDSSNPRSVLFSVRALFRRSWVTPPQDDGGAIELRESSRWPKVTRVAFGKLRELSAIAQQTPPRPNIPRELSDDEASITARDQAHTREPGDVSDAVSGQGTKVSTGHLQPDTSTAPPASHSQIETPPRGAATSPVHKNPSEPKQLQHVPDTHDRNGCWCF
ncbi:WD40-repeat-containing domain protein [Melanogaster broomeanus]|nr:WD40-repeat-containing domain protein [Melanogaster broomeanus]